jgi:hypothetical protein
LEPLGARFEIARCNNGEVLKNVCGVRREKARLFCGAGNVAA